MLEEEFDLLASIIRAGEFEGRKHSWVDVIYPDEATAKRGLRQTSDINSGYSISYPAADGSLVKLKGVFDFLGSPKPDAGPRVSKPIGRVTAVSFHSNRQGTTLSIEALERRIGQSLPAAWANILDQFETPIVFETCVAVSTKERHPSRPDAQQAVSLIFGRNSGKDGLLEMMIRYKGRVQEQFVPIAEAEGGDIYFWDAVTGRVMFWIHDHASPEDSPHTSYLVADSVEDFIDAFHEEDG